LVQNDPSRFISEVPEQYIDRSYAGLAGARGAIGSANSQSSGFGPRQTFARKQAIEPKQTTGNIVAAKKVAATAANFSHTPSADFTPSNPADMAVGHKVEHQRFGFGTITNLDGNPNNRMATIAFGPEVGVKKIMLQYAKLKIVE
jgi:DNA helicase-2/ATP-dependent DNA helicase PcrA